MSKTSDKICSWKLTNISDQICSQSWRHAEHRWWHDEEVHCCHQVSNKTKILQKFWLAIFLLLFFSRNQKEGQPGSWTTYGNVKVFDRPLILHYEMHLRLRLWALLIHVYLSIELFFIMRCIWALLIQWVFVNSPQINMEDPGFIDLMKEYYTVLVRQKIQPKLFMIAVKDNVESVFQTKSMVICTACRCRWSSP